MKLICNVPQRRGGSPVKAKGPSGAEYNFTVDEADGLMTADVTDDRDVAHFLALADSFEPADEADFNRAEALLAEEEARRKAEAGEGDDDGEGDDGEDDDDPIDPNAPPLEANTPAKPADPAKPPKQPKQPKQKAAPAA